MRKWILGLLLVNMVVGAQAQQSEHNKLIKKRVILPYGWALTPAGRRLPLGELPRNMAVSSTGKYLAVTDNGQNAGTLQLIDAEKDKILDATGIPSSCMGLKFSADEKFLYASGGNGHSILKYEIVRGKLLLSDSIIPGNKWSDKIVPEGLDIDDKRQLLYVVTGEDHSLYVVDLAKKGSVERFDLGGEGTGCLLSGNREWLYILCRGSDKILVFDTKTARITGSIPVGSNPNDLCMTRDDRFLFVASNNDHSVSVIDAGEQKVIQTLNAALFTGVPSVSAANGLALSEDQKTLYIANGDNNCLSVWDISQPGSGQCKGFIPVGWFPVSVKLAGRKLFVANGKGFSSLANTNNTDNGSKDADHSGPPIRYHNGTNDWSREVRYIVDLFTGSLSILDEPEDKLLEVYSRLVYQNCPYPRAKELLKSTELQAKVVSPSQEQVSSSQAPQVQVQPPPAQPESPLSMISMK
jgi:DNA-binding beta-propeller fold protein YncE